MSPNNPQAPLERSVLELSSITLTYNQAKSLRIEYNAFNYGYRNRVQYAMKIEGVSNEWQSVGNQHNLMLSNLGYGRYNLRIKASYDGVTWDEAGVFNFEIIVLPPWWATYWAFAIYALLIIIALVSGTQYLKMRLTLEMKLRTESNLRRNMEKLNVEKSRFFSYVSHDLKTPLTLILSPLQRMIEGREMTSRNSLEVIYRNAYRINFLIDELLTFSKIEMEQSRILVRYGNIIEFMGDLSKIFAMVAKERDIDFLVDLEPTIQEVWFSPSTLERIIYNLLSNAFKYTATDGYVKLSTKLVTEGMKTYAVIAVEDSGRGIPKEMHTKIFESYVQVNKSDNREGFGLGLSLTKSLVSIHKGEIYLDSEVGMGSTFAVKLNVSREAYSDEERSDEKITSDGLKKYNLRLSDKIEHISQQEPTPSEEIEERDSVLIVEDNPDMNQHLTSIFERDYLVLRAYNGVEACKIIERNQPTIIVSDIMMPKMDGITLTKRLKQDISTSHIPIVILTAKSEENDHTEGYQVGADAYIGKPFSANNLELLVKNLLQTRRLNIERFKRSTNLDINDITYSSRDEEFVKAIIRLTKENLANGNFAVSDITDHLKISRSLLHNKIKSLTGSSITQFVRSIKMKEAKRLITEGMNVSETSYAIGIIDPNYFTKCFKREFGVTPTDYIKTL